MYPLFLFLVSPVDWTLWQSALSEPLQLDDMQFKNVRFLELILERNGGNR